MLINLDAVYADVIEPEKRGDEDKLHASDLAACDYATYLRINGTPELPFDEKTKQKFMVGHAIEAWISSRFKDTDAYKVHRNVEVEYFGIVGHIDFLIVFEDELIAPIVIDATTTGGECEAKYPHTLKSAFYAIAVGAKTFYEWVFSIGYAGVIKEQKAFEFQTAAWKGDVYNNMKRLEMIQVREPEKEPHPNLGYNKCGKPGSGKSFCQARCPRNEAFNF